MTPEEINAINREIAEWLGWKEIRRGDTALVGVPPYLAAEVTVFDYYTSDSNAVTLLPVLVERGFWYQLNGVRENHSCEIGIVPGREMYISLVQPTVSAAICQAVIQVIRRGKYVEM